MYHEPQTTSYRRDQLTWLIFLLTGYFSYLQAVIASIMNFLSIELDYTYTQSSLHVSITALGASLMGFIGDRLTLRIGRWKALWFGGIGMVAGLLITTLGKVILVTAGGAFISGFCGGLVLITSQAVLSDHHRQNRGVALAEANVMASLVVFFAPLLAGEFQRMYENRGDAFSLDWRAAIYSPALAILILLLLMGRTSLPPIQESHSQSGVPKRLPFAFWSGISANAIGAAAEWSTLFFAPAFLEHVVGLSKIDATTRVSLFFVAMAVGRIVGSILSRRLWSGHLLLGAYALSMGGFLLLWQGGSQTLNIMGLFVTGLGIANLYPQGISLALSAAPGQTNAATSRNTLFVAGAIFAVPLFLGSLTDRVGIKEAYGVVLIILAVGMSLAFITTRLVKHKSAA